MGDVVARAKECHEQAVQEYGPQVCPFEITAATAACVVEEMRDRFIEGPLSFTAPLDVFNAVLAALT